MAQQAFTTSSLSAPAQAERPWHPARSSGMKILILERGDYVPREKENWSSLEVNLKGHYLAKEKWRTKDGEVLEPHTNYNVGGNTKFFGAALFRLRESDFGEIRHAAASRLHGRLTIKTLSPTTPRPRICSRCGANAVWIHRTAGHRPLSLSCHLT